MISSDEVRRTSLDLGVPIVQVEKDYVMGWLLWGISHSRILDNELILKGGSCLRKLYFADTRFSDDLDFTTRHQIQHFIDALFQPEIIGAASAVTMPQPAFFNRVPSAIREAIIEAGKTRRLIRMRYKSIDRTIEPYSFRYKVRRDGRGAEYFYGFDRTRGNTIKSFFLHQVQAVSILPEQYYPRWVVEF